MSIAILQGRRAKADPCKKNLEKPREKHESSQGKTIESSRKDSYHEHFRTAYL
jgi:hypothetical protein